MLLQNRDADIQVQLAELVSWDELALVYAKHLDPGAGRESVDLRIIMSLT